MKPYFLIPLFFFVIMLHPCFLPAVISEDSSIQIPADDNSQERQVERSPLEYEETESIWKGQRESETDNFQAKFFNMLLILGLLIGFMILASWALKRMMKTKMTQLNSGSHIKVLETRYLSPRASLHLIEVEDHAFLIAESPTAVTFLSSFSLETDEAKEGEISIH